MSAQEIAAPIWYDGWPEFYLHNVVNDASGTVTVTFRGSDPLGGFATVTIDGLSDSAERLNIVRPADPLYSHFAKAWRSRRRTSR